MIRPAVVGLAAFALIGAAPHAPRKASKAVDWTKTVVDTPDGGFRMGNPKAKITIVEYGSLTCPHCRHFAETAMKPLLGQYVRTGKASSEAIPRPVLCDDNLSALPVEYQEKIIAKYLDAGVKLQDANSGFAPRAFDQGTYERWSRILRGPWRFGYDELKEREQVRQMMAVLRTNGVSSRKMQVYCMIGNEPFADCMQRIREIHEWGGEPYCQRYMKLNTLEKTPWVRHDWTLQKLAHVARWVARHLSRPIEKGGIPFEKYNPRVKTRPRNKNQLEMAA